MKADPGGLNAAAVATESTPCAKLEVEWSSGTWTDESGNLVSANTDSQIVDPLRGWVSLATQPMGTMVAKVTNTDGRYSQSRAGSMAATYGIRGKHIRLWLGYKVNGTPTYPATPEFTGRIMDVTEGEASAEVDLTCQDMLSDAKRLNKSTLMQAGGALLDGVQTHNWITSLAGLANLSMAAASEAGLMMIPYCWLDDDELLAEMRAAAASEAGALFCDGSGNVVFWNAAHWAGKTHADYGDTHITVASFGELRPKRGYDDEWNIIACDYAPAGVGKPTKVYSLKRAVSVPPNSNKTMTLNFQWPLMSFYSYTLKACSSGGVDMGPSGANKVSISPSTPSYAKRWEITFSNSDTQNEAFITQFDVYGYPVDKRPAEQYIKDNSSGKPQPRRYNLPSNGYVQSEQQVRFLVDILADRLSTVRMQLQATQLRGHPLYELGDLVNIAAALTGVSTDCCIIGKHNTFGDGAWQMTLDLMDFSGMYVSTSYFKVGTSVLGVAGSQVVFY